MTRQNLSRMAMAIATAETCGIAQTCEEFQISDRTLRHWRNQESRNPELAELCRRRRADIAERWAESKAQQCLEALVAFISKSAESMDPKDPEALKSAAIAAKTLADIKLTSLALRVKFGDRAEL